MKYTLLILIALFFSTSGKTQVQFTVKPDLGGGILLHSYTSDTLIPFKRRNALAHGTVVHFNMIGSILTKNNKWLSSTGIGLAHHTFTIKESNGFDRFFEEFINGIFGINQPIPINNVRLQYQHITIPVGVSYNLTIKNPEKYQTFLGLQTNFQFTINKRVDFNYQSNRYTAAQLQIRKKEYSSRIESFNACFIPHFEFRTPLKKNMRSSFFIVPVAFYSKPYLSGLIVKPASFQFSYGLVFHLK